jgi:hypothetical protein
MEISVTKPAATALNSHLGKSFEQLRKKRLQYLGNYQEEEKTYEHQILHTEETPNTNRPKSKNQEAKPSISEK